MLGVVVGACVGGGERGLLRPFCVDECLGFRIWCWFSLIGIAVDDRMVAFRECVCCLGMHGDLFADMHTYVKMGGRKITGISKKFGSKNGIKMRTRGDEDLDGREKT